MNKIIIILILILLLISCHKPTNPVEARASTGLVGQPVIVHFISDNIGYAFSNIWTWIDDSNCPIKGCGVFKTVDGGTKWNKLCHIDDVSFTSIYTVESNNIYLMCEYPDGMDRIIKWDVIADSIVSRSNEIPTVSCIWLQDSILNVTTSHAPISLYTISLDLENICLVDSMEGYIIDTATNTKDGTLICVYSKQSGNEIIVLDGLKISRAITIPDFNPYEIISYDGDSILLIGYDKVSNMAKSVSYKLTTDSYTVYEFKGFDVISNLLKSGEKCVCLLGKIQGLFIEYSLLYKSNKTSPWKIIKLKNRTRCKPLSLSGDKCYIYGGLYEYQQVFL